MIAAASTCTVGPAAAIVLDVIHPGVRSTGASVLSLFQNLFGLALGPLVGGVLSASFGLDNAPPLAPPACLVAAAAFLSARRGQILSFDTREGWPGWDVVRALLPEAEIGDLIIEIRSATTGAGSFTTKFDHMAEVTGRTADQIVAAHRAAA